MLASSDGLRDHPFLKGMVPLAVDLFASFSSEKRITAGEYLFHEGGTAETFYLIRNGRVSIEVRPPSGDAVIVEAVGDGEVVGWSWAIPPYRWTFDARATRETDAYAVDALALREACDADPTLGYDVARRVIGVMSSRLHFARVRLLDLYGPPQ
jgi:CRP-like cAMP-binding protein